MTMNSPKSITIYVCQQNGCPRTYKSRFSLNRHMQQHQGVRKYRCEYCRKEFSLAQYLREHTRTHTGDRPYNCSYPGCGKSFRQSGKFSLHKKIHEPGSKSTCKTLVHEDVELLMEAMKFVSEAIKSFGIPYYFYSRALPVPEQLKEEIYLAGLLEKKDF